MENTGTREDFRAAFNALRSEVSALPEMSLDEINAEISEARSERLGEGHDRMKAADTLAHDLKRAEDRAHKEGWIDADEFDKKMGI